MKAAATELGIPVTDDIDDLLAIDAELGVVVAYGRIIKPPILAHLPMVNVHFSLLPRWRGAAPVERALLAGDDGHRRVHHGRRGGPRHRRRLRPPRRCRSAPARRPPSCAATLVEVGTALLVDVLVATARRRPSRRHGEVTYAAKIEPLRARDRLDLAGRRHRSVGARRRRVDDVPRPPAQGADAASRRRATARPAPSAPTASSAPATAGCAS